MCRCLSSVHCGAKMEKNQTNNNKIRKKSGYDQILRMIIAIGLAILLWFYINGTDSDLVTKDINNLPVTLTNVQQLTAKGLTVSENEQSYVNLKLRGTANNLSAINAEDLKAEVDLSRVNAEGQQELEIVIKGLPNSVILSTMNPERLPLNVNALESKTYEVTVVPNGKPADGHQLAEVKAREKVTIRGESSDISRIDSVTALVNINGLDSNSETYVDVAAYDKDGNKIDGLAIDPYKIFVEITIK